ncbi:hypothetical protein H5410_030849, partial [Solanum commersonii]
YCKLIGHKCSDHLCSKCNGDENEEIQKIEIPSFYTNNRIIDISTIIQELANNYLNENAIWSYYSRDQLKIYSNSRELRRKNMDEKKDLRQEHSKSMIYFARTINQILQANWTQIPLSSVFKM